MNTYKPDDLKQLHRCNPKAIRKNSLWIAIKNNPLHHAMLTIGDTFYYIIDFYNFNVIDYSPSFSSITGYEKEYAIKKGLQLHFDTVHPKDKPILQYIHKHTLNHNLSKPFGEKHQYRYTYDFRIKHKKGYWIRLLQNAVHIEFDDDGMPLYTFCVNMDISKIKKTPCINYSISKYDPSTQTYKVKHTENFSSQQNLVLTPRQKQIAYLIGKGYNNKDIAQLLSIKIETVKDQRKKMLRQNNLKTTAELIKEAVVTGLI